MSDSVQPHRWQPTRLPCPWDSPDKNTEVGCHFLLQCMKVKGESEVTQSCATLSDPMNCSPPGSSVHGIFQARVLEWGAIAFSNWSPYNSPYTITFKIWGMPVNQEDFIKAFWVLPPSIDCPLRLCTTHQHAITHKEPEYRFPCLGSYTFPN